MKREGENSFLAAGYMPYSLIDESASPLRSFTLNVHPVKHMMSYPCLQLSLKAVSVAASLVDYKEGRNDAAT
jgi:hypothetical protein